MSGGAKTAFLAKSHKNGSRGVWGDAETESALRFCLACRVFALEPILYFGRGGSGPPLGGAKFRGTPFRTEDCELANINFYARFRTRGTYLVQKQP